jgi:purine-binding chemotaxis protein CheW
MVAITPVPEAPSWLVGVINLHGRVIPVLDLRRRFGLSPREPHPDDRLLIVRTRERTMAIIVDEATDVLQVPAQQLESPPDPASRSWPLAAVIQRNGDLVLVLDAARLLPLEEEDEPIEDLVDLAQIESALTKHDLTQIKGVGPVYASKLATGGIHTFGSLAAVTAEEIVALLGLSTKGIPAVQDWIEQARRIAGSGS